MTKWEYKFWQPKIEDTIEAALMEMNQLGAQGWELVAHQSSTFWFKRQPVEPYYPYPAGL